jgi:competence protein ComEC
MRDFWTRRATFFLLGGIVGVYTPEPARFVVLGIFLMFGIRIWLWKPQDFFGLTVRPEGILLSLSFLVGILYGFTGSASLEPPLLLNRVEMTGELRDWKVDEDGATGILRIVEPLPLEGNSLVSPRLREQDLMGKTYRLKVYSNSDGKLPGGWENIRPGDRIKFFGKLEHPKPPGTSGQFDLPLYYAVRGISGGITAQNSVEIIAPGTPPLSWRVRNRVHEVLLQIPKTQPGLLEGILFGDTSGIPEEDLERYRITGVYHIFSASGSNVAFILLLCWGALRFLPPFLRVGISSAVLIFYTLLCGGNPPILRATVMGIFLLIGRLGSGKGNPLRGLFFASLLLFFWQPLILKDIGFQLSFMATWGIIVLAPRIEGYKGFRRLPKALGLALATTLAAQAATLPILVGAFHRLSFMSFLANVGALFLLGSVFELGIIGLILSFIPVLSMMFFQVSLWLLSLTNAVLFQLARIPWADVWVVNPGMLFGVVWTMGISMLLVGKEKVVFVGKVWGRKLERTFNPYLKPLKYKKMFLLSNGQVKREQVTLTVILILLFWSPWNTPQLLEITFIDVGQGDSILIETPQGKCILIDAGPKSERFDAGEKIILPFLLQNGIRHLDALILTHSHADHVGGAAALLENLPIEWVGIPDDGLDWLSEESVSEENGSARSKWEEREGLEPRLIRLLAGKRLERLKEGDILNLDSNIRLSVLAPKEVLIGIHSDANNNSLVLRLENQTGQSVLLTADMEEEEMLEIEKTGQDFSADLFKVPHHGSRFSLVTDWLNQIDPKVVIIPVGRNSFGHPNSEVLKYWEERQIPIYRTDEDGTIRVRIDEKGLEILPGREKYRLIPRVPDHPFWTSGIFIY